MDLAGPQEMNLVGCQQETPQQETPPMDLAGTQETLVLDLAGPQEMDLVGCQQETPPMDLVLGDRPVPDLVGLVDLVGQYIWNFDAGTPGPQILDNLELDLDPSRWIPCLTLKCTLHSLWYFQCTVCDIFSLMQIYDFHIYNTAS